MSAAMSERGGEDRETRKDGDESTDSAHSESPLCRPLFGSLVLPKSFVLDE